MTECGPARADVAARASSLPLALTMGDPAGIGADIALTAWAERERLKLPPFVVYADAACLEERAHKLRLPISLAQVADPVAATSLFARALPVRQVTLAKHVIAGEPDSVNAPAIISAIQDAVADVVAARAAAVVTNPVAKAVLFASGFRHPGHTEFLAELASRFVPGRRWVPVMMLASDVLRVVPMTVHVPVAAVPGAITRERLLETAGITHQALQRDFAIAHPRIVVAGLNPHAGESGTIGREEVDIIAPAIAELQAQGLAISGPYSADSLFHPGARARYDAAITMYHDQALIPLKTLAFDTGVNVTLGLPFVRTSPDHGTAFDIAGSGSASPSSLVAALRMAAAMAQRRAEPGT